MYTKQHDSALRRMFEQTVELMRSELQFIPRIPGYLLDQWRNYIDAHELPICGGAMESDGSQWFYLP